MNNQGENHHAAKLTDDNVRTIRARLKQGDTQWAVAQEFGVSQGSISKIHNRRQWLHVR